MPEFEQDIIQIDETVGKAQGEKIDKSKLKAYCTSPLCCAFDDKVLRKIKKVSIQTEICPDCGYYLFWHTPQSKWKLY